MSSFFVDATAGTYSLKPNTIVKRVKVPNEMVARIRPIRATCKVSPGFPFTKNGVDLPNGRYPACSYSQQLSILLHSLVERR
jgi:hypothetical protein